MRGSVSRWASGLGFLKSPLDALLGFFYPPVCLLCREEPAGPASGYVGARCAGRVRHIQGLTCRRCGLPFPGEPDLLGFECQNCREMHLRFRTARAAVAAEGVMLEMIHRYKYGHQTCLEPFLAGLLETAATGALLNDGATVLVPIPLHPVKLRERGFNQAERLACALARKTGLPVARGALRRCRATASQTRLGRRERIANLHGAFALNPGREWRGERVVLIDDVLTTGATANACARVLQSAGAADVQVWTVARGLRAPG